jgi:hypothetical protein
VIPLFWRYLRMSIVKRFDRSQILFRYGRRWKTQAFLLLLWLAMGAFPAWAQTGASLSGVVTDQTGAGLRDVAVTIKSVDTGATRTIATDGVGHYQASGLPPGLFEIRAVKQGFADETPTGVN